MDGLVVSREAPPHPEIADIWTLGECRTEDYLSDWGSPETTRSKVVLYWGSFRNLSRRDAAFDWEGELWETLTHELRHHLESLAGEDALEGVDYALDETFKREGGETFDPWYYQRGEAIAPGVFRVETDVYVEQAWWARDFERAEFLELGWEGSRYRVSRPDELGDVHFVLVEGIVEPPERLELVLVRRRKWFEELGRVTGTSRPRILESEAVAEPVEAG